MVYFYPRKPNQIKSSEKVNHFDSQFEREAQE